MRQYHGQPILIGTHESLRLEPVSLSNNGATFNEAWLQRLIHDHPECLPVAEIEPAFDELVPVCMEMPTMHGPMDNLLMTPEGDLVLVEVKLWRNPEARRKVVAQALDYASCLFEMDYAELEQAVFKANFGEAVRPNRLYDVFADHSPKDEAAFIDAVNANLRRGRALILVAGDGIRTEAARLASLVQSHAGAHFTFALVELGVFRMPESESYLVLPRTLAQTEMISRAIVQIDDRRTIVKLPDQTKGAGTAKPIAATISAEQFYDAMKELDETLPETLQAFVAKLETLGVHPDFRRSLILRWDPPTGRSVNLGYVMRNGHIYTDATTANSPKDLARSYIKELAEAWGLSVAPGGSGQTWNLRSGSAVPHIEKIAAKLDAGLPVIERFLDRMRVRAAETSS